MITKALDNLYKHYPLYSAMFDKQLQFALAPAKYKAALCSRRAGKTKGILLEIFQDALITPNSLSLYLALTDESVLKIVFPITREIMNQFKLNIEITGNEIRFSNGSVIAALGANHINKIESFRGTKLLNCVIDEAASFSENILARLLDEVISPALIDNNGKLIFAGSPASHCSGSFFKATTGLEDGWFVQHWTGFDNPFVKESFIDKAKKYLIRKKVDENDPGYRREFRGEWCADEDLLMIKPFIIQKLPEQFNTDTWRCVIGVDFGFNDKTAFSVVGWRKNNPKAYVIESYGVSSMSVTEISHHLRRLYETYKPNRIVGDPAGASLIIMKEFADKHNIFLSKAEKSDKKHYIEILNDALINAELVLCPETTKELQEEFKSVVWNDKRTREHDGKPCDCLDATLYAFRDSLAFTEKIPVKVEMTDKMLEQEILDRKMKQYINKPANYWDDPVEGDILFGVESWS